MSVSKEEPRVQYLASDGQTEFDIPFEFFKDEDIVAYKTPVGQTPDPNIDKLFLNTDYTLTGAGDDAGGKLTLVVAATENDIITIERDFVVERGDILDFKVDGLFKAEDLNINFDRIIMFDQQNKSRIDNRMLVYPATEQLTDGQTTLPKLPANHFWKANASQNLAAVILEEVPDWSTLRSELASQSSTAPGTDIVGAYKTEFGGGQSLTSYLNTLYSTVQESTQKCTWISGTTTGTNTYIVNTSPTFTPAEFSRLYIKIGSTNTGASTLNVNSHGALPISDQWGGSLHGGELYSGRGYHLLLINNIWHIQSDRTPATKSQMEAALYESYSVVPVNMKWHPGIAKAMAVWSQSKDSPYTITEHYLYNVTSITDWSGGPDLGYIQLNFSITMANVNFATVTGTGTTNGAESPVHIEEWGRTTTTAKFRLIKASTGEKRGGDYNSVIVFGTLAT